MSLTFHRANRVETGDPVTSGQLVDLALAFNDRLRSGIADGAERILYYTRNAFLNIDASAGLPQSHFFTQRQTVDPEHSEWPTGGPGESNGAELGANFPAFVFGSESLGLVDEGRRLTDPLVGGMPVEPAANTPQGYWELGKRQRGAYDSTTGAMASPSFAAARAYAAIRWRWWSPHGSSWGGFFPSPAVSATPCEDPDTSDEYGPPVNFEVFFTSLADGVTVKAYSGTCQDGPDLSTPGMYDDHIYAIGYAPWAYYVMLNDGTLEELSTNEWVEGPYAGEPQLLRAWGNHFERFGHRFAGELRGSEANAQAMVGRTVTKASRAFNHGRFLRQQYLLAPSKGMQAGDEVVSEYLTLSMSPGAEQSLFASAGFVFAAIFVIGTGSVSVASGGQIIGTVAANAAGRALALHPAPAEMILSSTGSVHIEVAELLDYKPAPWDAILVSRIGAARL